MTLQWQLAPLPQSLLSRLLTSFPTHPSLSDLEERLLSLEVTGRVGGLGALLSLMGATSLGCGDRAKTPESDLQLNVLPTPAQTRVLMLCVLR